MWQKLSVTALIQGFQPGERGALERAESMALEQDIKRDLAAGLITDEEAAARRAGIETLSAACLERVAEEGAAEVTAECRMLIASGGRARMPADTALLPPGLIAAATAILRYNLLTRYALDIAEPRKVAYDAARDLLDRVSKGEVAVDEELETTPHPAYYGRPSKVWGVRRRGIL